MRLFSIDVYVTQSLQIYATANASLFTLYNAYPLHVQYTERTINYTLLRKDENCGFIHTDVTTVGF